MKDHPIRKFIKENGLTVVAFASLVRLNPGSIYRYYRGEPIQRESIRKIVRATHGRISEADLEPYRQRHPNKME